MLARLAAVALLVPALASAQEAGHTRDGWYIGFGLGTGAGTLTTQGGTTFSFRDVASGSDTTTVALNFKVGGTLSRSLLLGFDLSTVQTQGEDLLGNTARLGVTNYDAMLTWFPWETGFLLRGGAGLSTMTLSASAYGLSGSTTYTGANLAAGAGYAFWLGQRFNLVLNLDFSGAGYGSGTTGPKRSGMWAASLGFDWY